MRVLEGAQFLNDFGVVLELFCEFVYYIEKDTVAENTIALENSEKLGFCYFNDTAFGCGDRRCRSVRAGEESDFTD